VKDVHKHLLIICKPDIPGNSDVVSLGRYSVMVGKSRSSNDRENDVGVGKFPIHKGRVVRAIAVSRARSDTRERVRLLLSSAEYILS
jgi:hypothetical protein